MKARCIELRQDLETIEAPVTKEELDDYWPGGAENKLTGRGAWIYCWARYNAYLDRTQEKGPSEADEQAADLAALKAFRDHPVVVELANPLPDGTIYLTVHPKSFDTLTLLDEIEEELRWLLERIEWLQGRWEQEAPAQVGEALRLLSEFELYAVWICTTDGASVPFNPSLPWPPLPDWLRALEVLDILAVMKGHHAVNKHRIGLIASSLRKRGTEDRKASWATLAMRAGGSLGVPMDHLLKSRSFASWFAEVALKWDDQAEQHERAQGKSRAPDPLAGAIG